MNQIIQPAQIEKTSFAIITKELGNRTFPDGQAEVVKRVIHTTADFDYADTLCFSEDALSSGKNALQKGATIVTDTSMALSGINKTILGRLGGEARCFISDPSVAAEAKERRYSCDCIYGTRMPITWSADFCNWKCTNCTDSSP